MNAPYRGSCLCGQIRFEADRLLPRTGSCHCSMCRKFHGAAFATLAEALALDFRWTAGEEMLQAYVADNGTTRRFCRNCGSSLTFASPETEPELVEIALACFDDAVPVKPDAHIYVDSGADWARPQDDLPQYRAGRDSQRIK